jgi:hypothetical protein
MKPRSFLKTLLASGCALGAFLATNALAAPTTIVGRNLITTTGSVSTTFNGQTFVNQGLQGVNRLSALTTKDFAGDTFGAYSGLDVAPGTWRKTATGYTGVLYSLPDRGPNSVGTVTFSDYAGRINAFDMNFTPYTGSAAISATANVLALTQKGGLFLRDFNGNLTTGLDPQLPSANSYVTQNGMNLPGNKTGAAAGKISLDAEALRFLNDGSFYVGDEYGANVYYFDKSGNMKGVIQPPTALIPRTSATGTTPDTLSYTSLADAAVGRRFNQGMEGMAITPDQKKLVTLLQSGSYQDTPGGAVNRHNTRLMIYDITGTRAPTNPIGDYVLQLPIYNTTGSTTAAANATAAQSELLALNDSQFLVLSRDGNGLGQANNPPSYKSVLLVDITGATNIAGTTYETSYTPISPGGTLLSSITPVQQVEVINMLNTTQLSKFGINVNNAAGQTTSTTLTEKWEGMALVPVLEETAPQDFFLLVGNDNDFLSSTCSTTSGGTNAQVACGQPINSDALVFVYRLTLPTYVDPTYLNSMITTGPTVLALTQMAAHDLAVSNGLAQHLGNMRHNVSDIRPAQLAGMNLSVWASGNFINREESTMTTSAQIGGASVGVDAEFAPGFLLGAAVGYQAGHSNATGGFHASHSAVQASLYGAYEMAGFSANLSGTYSAQDFRSIDRPGAYGLTGQGTTEGTGFAVVGEAAYMLDMGNVRLGPVAGFRWLNVELDGYTEINASGGNIVMPGISNDGVSGFFGGEASMALTELISGIVRVAYNTEESYHTGNASFRLLNAANVMGTQSVALPGLGQASIEPSLTLTGTGAIKWWASYGARFGVDDGTEHRVSLGARVNF